MAWVVVVLDDLFGLPVTTGAVGVLEGRSFSPGDALCRPHYPLESPGEFNGCEMRKLRMDQQHWSYSIILT
jgi:hypothetical protein